MALGERLKKSLNRGKTFGRGKSRKFESNGNDSYRVRSEIEETKSLFTERKFVRKGRDSDVKIFGRKPTNGRQRAGEEYMSTRGGLERVCLHIDTKWGMKPRDHELIDLMERSRPHYQIVLTKTDISFPHRCCSPSYANSRGKDLRSIVDDGELQFWSWYP